MIVHAGDLPLLKRNRYHRLFATPHLVRIGPGVMPRFEPDPDRHRSDPGPLPGLPAHCPSYASTNSLHATSAPSTFASRQASAYASKARRAAASPCCCARSPILTCIPGKRGWMVSPAPPCPPAVAPQSHPSRSRKPMVVRASKRPFRTAYGRLDGSPRPAA